VTAIRKASEVAASVCFEGEGPSLDWSKGGSVVTADRLALVERLRELSLEWFSVGVDEKQAGALANAADVLEREIRDAE
jgi:hypothetical protein